jgi:outer membrane protein assembly factor BamD (BamD/ComL family)
VLARESALIARAQSALARGEPALAIAALREHETRHPRGQLAEEREALWISALVGAGDGEGARARAARFRARHPGSPLLPAVEASLEAAP